jgi:hypothetical protein
MPLLLPMWSRLVQGPKWVLLVARQAVPLWETAAVAVVEAAVVMAVVAVVVAEAAALAAATIRRRAGATALAMAVCMAVEGCRWEAHPRLGKGRQGAPQA